MSPPAASSSDAARRAAGRVGVALVGVAGAVGAGAALHFLAGQLVSGLVGVGVWAGVVGGTVLALFVGLVIAARVKHGRLRPLPVLAAAGLLLCTELAVATTAFAAMRPAGGRVVFMVLSVVALLPPITYARLSLTPVHESERPITDAVDL